ncbi:type I restriction enzyme HsdR N-terminal domain-containing protein [Salibacteraceae bacterium]|jgi:hypothetical protein|nr:type I restriction enzyme HsdR N-terminal domain-containing protein [Salibacteraceae bacterium]MDB9708983.1 type I restriction enzyme HsdR N-terminal domain-containing protein [Salibacteraceae bacterium]
MFDAKVRSIDDQIQIFDVFREKYVSLTPEEWVRQHFSHYLVEHLGHPKTHIQLEYQLKYARVKKRPDIGVINNDSQLEILIECKAPSIALNEDVFLQLTSYFSVDSSKYIVLTNGLQHIFAAFEPSTGKFVYLQELPAYK